MEKIKIQHLTPFLYMVATLSVILTAWVDGWEDLLPVVSKESGFFESFGALMLFVMAFVGFYWVYKNRLLVNRFALSGVGFFAFICFLASMEEISWGQFLFHFESSHFFKLHNNQHETNLHNLMSASLFSSIVYFCVYGFYIFIPLFIHLLSVKIDKLTPLLPYLPSFHVTLIILYASSFQAYFYDDFGALFDTLTLLFGMVLFLTTSLLTRKMDKKIFIHFVFVSLNIAICMLSYKIFSFYNLQYEIRETFVVFATFIYFLHGLKLLKSPKFLL